MQEDLAAAERWNRAVDVVERPVLVRDLLWNRPVLDKSPGLTPPPRRVGSVLGFLVAVVGGVLLGSRRACH